MSNNRAVHHALHRLALQGSPYEVGYQLGCFGKHAVHSHLLQTPAWGNLQKWRGSAPLAHMQVLVQTRFPRIWQELIGLAEGLELPVQDVLLWNCRGDLWAMSPDGCSTVLLPGERAKRLTHNEDGDPGFSGYCAIAAFHIQGSPDFVSFVYPGSLPGHTFAANAHGLCMTVNNIRALCCEPGVPRMVLARAVLDCRDVPSAITILRDMPRAGAFHFSLGDVHTPGLTSVEFSSHYCAVAQCTQPVFHANHAIHADARDFPQIITGSSGYRQRRGNALLAQASAAGKPPCPLDILEDDDGSRFPILRLAADDSDNENTLANADFHIDTSGISWKVRERPAGEIIYALHNASFITADTAPEAG